MGNEIEKRRIKIFYPSIKKLKNILIGKPKLLLKGLSNTINFYEKQL